MKRVLKYGTGDVIPAGARHLQTLVQTAQLVPDAQAPYADWVPCYFVWHYYEVDVQVEEIKCIPPDDCPVCREEP